MRKKYCNSLNMRSKRSELRPQQWEREEGKGKKKPMKVVAENCKRSITEKNEVEDVSKVSRELVCFIVIPRPQLEIQLRNLQNDYLICSHGLTLISCPRLVGWMSFQLISLNLCIFPFLEMSSWPQFCLSYLALIHLPKGLMDMFVTACPTALTSENLLP